MVIGAVAGAPGAGAAVATSAPIAAAEPRSTARIEKRPARPAIQRAVNVPPEPMTALAAGAQRAVAPGPSRWISTTSPASAAGALPLSTTVRRSMSQGRAASVSPSPEAVTVAPAFSCTAGPPVEPPATKDAPPVGVAVPPVGFAAAPAAEVGAAPAAGVAAPAAGARAQHASRAQASAGILVGGRLLLVARSIAVGACGVS